MPRNPVQSAARTRLALAGTLCMLVAGAARPAPAAKRVVLLGISGSMGADATRQISSALAGRYELVSRGQLAAEAKRRGASLDSAAGRCTAARALRIAALVSGSLSRARLQWVVRIVVYSGHSGSTVGSASLPLRGMRLDPMTARRLVGNLGPALARARSGPPLGRAPVAARPTRPRPAPVATPRPAPVAVRPAPTPPPRPARPKRPGEGEFDDGNEPPAADPTPEDDPKPAPRHAPKGRRTARAGESGGDLGFEVGDGGDEGGAEPEETPRPKGHGRHSGSTTEYTKKKSDRDRPEYETVIELGGGLMLLSRSFDFNDPVQPKNPSNYRSGMVPALLVDGAIYPFAYFGRGPLSNLGLVGSYYRVPVLRSQLPGYSEPVDTTFHELQLGLRYRWNILGRPTSPTLKAGIDFGRLGFVIHWDPNMASAPPLPNVIYLFLKLAILDFGIPFYHGSSFSFGMTATFDYLYIFSAGDIERTDTGGYGRSSTGGIDVGAGAYATFGGWFVKFTGFYRRVFYAFDNQCYKDNTGCNAAGGALDIYKGLTLTGGYAY